MPKRLTAIYQNGVLKPSEKLDLPENKVVRIAIYEDDLPSELIASVAEKGGSYDFFGEAGEDIYSSRDGEEIA